MQASAAHAEDTESAWLGLPQPLHAIAVLLLIVAVWLAMWHVFLKHVPILANLKAVLLGERTLPPRGKTRRTTFRDPSAKAAE
mmetsp:Transcript_46254/g.142670  ORF Transcript_46254/g.142670 Transcript_46254/m.142670 type:complete len:83 (+) Transcript_46254:62-310(+)